MIRAQLSIKYLSCCMLRVPCTGCFVIAIRNEWKCAARLIDSQRKNGAVSSKDVEPHKCNDTIGKSRAMLYCKLINTIKLCIMYLFYFIYAYMQYTDVYCVLKFCWTKLDVTGEIDLLWESWCLLLWEDK